MRAVYVDTPQLLLARHRITLRRREGGTDEGWHLKLPADQGRRLEFHAPLSDGPRVLDVPAELRETALAALRRARSGDCDDDQDPDDAHRLDGPEATLLPAATLTTYRVELDLTGPGGRLLAQLCDDTVMAQPSGETWRELEVELVEGDESLLDQIVQEFGHQGVPEAAAPSKLSRALGDRPARAARGTGPRRSGPAADVVREHLLLQVAEIVGRTDDVREDRPDAVHRMRVATRRLRTALRTFRRLLDREVTDPLRDDLRWLAHVLGAARDAEVMRDRVLEQLGELPAEQVGGPVRVRVEAAAAARHTPAHAAVVSALDSARYDALVDALLHLVAEPPWRGRAHRRARRVLPPLVDRAAERAVRAWDQAAEAEGEERIRRLHDTRKRAKAVRYAAEALRPSFGRQAKDLARAWKQVTQALGEVQDAAVTSQWLLELARDAEGAGEPMLTYGALLQRESQRAARGDALAADLMATAGRVRIG